MAQTVHSTNLIRTDLGFIPEKKWVDGYEYYWVEEDLAYYCEELEEYLMPDAITDWNFEE